MGRLQLLGWTFSVVATILFGSAAFAECKDRDKAQAHYQEGDKAYRLGDFPRAEAEFRASYELCPVPLLIYNLAQANRFGGDLKQALFFYRQYLSLGDPKQREAAEKRVTELEAQLARQSSPNKAGVGIDEARLHYKRGFSAYGLQHYDEAAREYEAAFQLAPDAALIFNAAQAHRLAGNTPRALNLYRSYIRLFGEQITNRQEVERLIETLQIQLQQARRTAPSPKPEPKPTAVVAPVMAQAAASRPRAPAKPWYRRGWVWGTVGGVAAAALAVGLGAGLGAQPKDPTPSIGGVRF